MEHIPNTLFTKNLRPLHAASNLRTSLHAATRALDTWEQGAAINNGSSVKGPLGGGAGFALQCRARLDLVDKQIVQLHGVPLATKDENHTVVDDSGVPVPRARRPALHALERCGRRPPPVRPCNAWCCLNTKDFFENRHVIFAAATWRWLHPW